MIVPIGGRSHICLSSHSPLQRAGRRPQSPARRSPVPSYPSYLGNCAARFGSSSLSGLGAAAQASTLSLTSYSLFVSASGLSSPLQLLLPWEFPSPLWFFLCAWALMEDRASFFLSPELYLPLMPLPALLPQVLGSAPAPPFWTCPSVVSQPSRSSRTSQCSAGICLASAVSWGDRKRYGSTARTTGKSIVSRPNILQWKKNASRSFFDVPQGHSLLSGGLSGSSLDTPHATQGTLPSCGLSSHTRGSST